MIEACIQALFDPHSFEAASAAGVRSRIGVGRVGGRHVVLLQHRNMPVENAAAEALAAERECPIVYLFCEPPPAPPTGPRPTAEQDAARGASMLDLMAEKEGVGRVFNRHARLAGKTLQIAGVITPMFSARAFPIALCDFAVFMDRLGAVGLCLPLILKGLTGEDVQPEALCGPMVHAKRTGLADAVVPDPVAVGLGIRALLGFLPSLPGGDLPRAAARPPKTSGRTLEQIVPSNENAPFAPRALIDEIVDEGSCLETKALFAPELRTLFARIEGRTVGILANDSSQRGGILFVDTCRKAVRFLELCESLGVPLVFLADCPGFMVGKESEADGIVSAASRWFSTLSLLTVPRVSVVVRKAYTAGLYAMCGPAFDPDAFIALPTASIGLFGPKVNAAVDDKRFPGAFEFRATRSLAEWNERGIVEAIVPLEELRAKIATTLAAAPARRGSSPALRPTPL